LTFAPSNGSKPATPASASRRDAPWQKAWATTILILKRPGLCRCRTGYIRDIGARQAAKIEQKFPDYVRLVVTKTGSGDVLSRIAYEANAYLFPADEDLTEEAKGLAAFIFDFLRDLGDLGVNRLAMLTPDRRPTLTPLLPLARALQ
jgi:hypothetical protein